MASKKSDSADKKVVNISVSTYVDDLGLFYEEIYDPEYNKAGFVSWDNLSEKLVKKDYFEKDGNGEKFRYVPINNQAVRKRAVLLPSNALEYGSTEQLANEIVLSDDFYDEEMVLRNKLLMFRLQNLDRITLTRVEDIDLGDIEPRLKQDIISFAMLFWNFDGMRRVFTEFIRRYSQELVEERAATFEGMIVNSIFELYNEPHDVTDVTNVIDVTSRDIAEKMAEKYNLDKAPDPRVVGRHLRILGLETELKKIQGESKPKRVLKWDAERMKQLQRKYVGNISNISNKGNKGEVYKIQDYKLDVDFTRDIRFPERLKRFKEYIRNAEDKGYVIDDYFFSNQTEDVQLFKDELERNGLFVKNSKGKYYFPVSESE